MITIRVQYLPLHERRYLLDHMTARLLHLALPNQDLPEPTFKPWFKLWNDVDHDGMGSRCEYLGNLVVSLLGIIIIISISTSNSKPQQLLSHLLNSVEYRRAAHQNASTNRDPLSIPIPGDGGTDLQPSRC